MNSRSPLPFYLRCRRREKLAELVIEALDVTLAALLECVAILLEEPEAILENLGGWGTLPTRACHQLPPP